MDAQKYMLRCLELAQKASDEDEVPIGAAVVDPESGEIVSEAYNLSEHKLDATAHAETLAIRRACEKLGVKPCTMCAAAISMARIKTLYFGAYDPKGGAVVNGVRFYDSPTCHHRPEVCGGILEAECGEILKRFFRSKRRKL